MLIEFKHLNSKENLVDMYMCLLVESNYRVKAEYLLFNQNTQDLLFLWRYCV